MVVKEIKAIRNYCIKHKIPFEIILDNLIHMQYPSEFILWNDESESLSAYRKNSKRGQKSNPIEETVSSYDMIQHIRVFLPKELLEDYIKYRFPNSCYTQPQIDAMVEYFDKMLDDTSYLAEHHHEYTDKK